MSVTTHLPRYGRLSIALHWLMLLLIAAVYATIELKGNFAKGSEPRELLKHVRIVVGIGQHHAIARMELRGLEASILIVSDIE